MRPGKHAGPGRPPGRSPCARKRATLGGSPYVHGSIRASGAGPAGSFERRTYTVRTAPRVGAHWFVRTPYVRGSNRASGAGPAGSFERCTYVVLTAPRGGALWFF